MIRRLALLSLAVSVLASTPTLYAQFSNVTVTVYSKTTIEPDGVAAECGTSVSVTALGFYQKVEAKCTATQNDVALPGTFPACDSQPFTPSPFSVAPDLVITCTKKFTIPITGGTTFKTSGQHSIFFVANVFGPPFTGGPPGPPTDPCDFILAGTHSFGATGSFTITCLLDQRPLIPGLFSFQFANTLDSETTTTVTPTAASLVPTQHVDFKSNNPVSWSIIPTGVGTLTTTSTTATYKAPDSIDSQQDLTLKACSQTPGDCDTATITLYPLTVTVNPISAAVLPAKPLPLKATVTGPPNVDQTVTWSFAPGSPQVGTIDKTGGIYSTPPQVTTPATVIIRATSNLDTTGMSFGTATISIGPVNIAVSGPTDFLATPGAHQTYTASVISPGNTDVSWTPIAPATAGTIVQTSSSSAQYTAPTPALPSLTPVKIEACLVADKDFCGSLSVTLSPQVTIASVAPNAWPSGQPTAVTITGSGFGSSPPNVNVSDPFVNFSLSAFTNTVIQGTVSPPIIPSAEPVTLTVTSASNPINSFATSGTIIINPAAITVTLFPAASTLLETQQQTFNATVGCKLANGSSCAVSPLVICSLNPPVGTVTPAGPTTSCTYTATATVTGQQSVPVQLIAKSFFNPNSSGLATITLTPLNVTVAPLIQALGGGQTQKFTAAVTGAVGNNNGVNWSLVKLQPSDPLLVGNIDQTGLYTAPNPIGTAQTFLVKACSQIDPAVCGQAQITLTPFSVTVSPGTVSLTPGATQQFSSTTLGASNTGVTWTITPSVGTISPIGLYTAPPSIPTAQTVTVKACSVITPAPPNPCGTAIVNLVVVPDFSVSATPTSQTVAPGGSAVYSVIVTPINGFTGTVSFNCPVTPLTTAVTVSGCSNSISLASSPVSFPVTVTTVSSITPQNYTITATGTAGLLTHSSALTLNIATPIPVFSPTPVSFPDQNPNTSSAPTIVTLTNAGNAPLLISSASITGGDSSNFGLTNNCPASLAANTSCTFTVIFAPTAVRQFLGALTITDNAAGSSHSVSLNGKGVVSVPVFSATALVFGPQVVRTASAPQSITLTNAGTTPISGISASSGFLQTNTCGTSLPMNASCTITVSFSPIFGGLNLGNISVTGSTTVVSLTGSGIPTLTKLTPGTVTAGSDNFTLGLTGDGFTRSAMVRVNGITRLAMPVDLQHLNVAITSSDVANIGSFNVSVVIPGTGGQESGTLPLTVTSSPIPLIGNIVPARVIAGYQLPLKLIVNGSFFTPDSVVQINGAPRPTTFISPSQLTAILPITDFVASALPSITVVNPAALVPANAASLAVFRYGDLTFDNTLSVLDLLALANVLAGNNTPSDPAPGDLNLDGKADVQDLLILANFLAGNVHTLPVISDQAAFLFNAGATVTLSPPTFAGQIVGAPSDPLPVKLTNGGPTPLSIAGIGTSPEFSQTNDCGIALAGNGSCTIYLTFTPAAAGKRSGTLTVQDNSTNGPHTATLSGFGIASAVPPSPPAASLSVAGTNSDSAPVLTFPSQAVGTASASQTLTLTNQGSTQLTISGIVISSGNEFAQSNNCGSSLAANASCTITVTFSPSVAGTRTASLAVTDNAGNSPQTANLSGTGSGLGGGGVTDGPHPPPPPIDN